MIFLELALFMLSLLAVYAIVKQDSLPIVMTFFLGIMLGILICYLIV